MYAYGMDEVLAAGPTVAGVKAHALAVSAAAGCSVPGFFVVTPDALGADQSLAPAAVCEIATQLSLLAGQGFARFAVRSSARSEDGTLNSHAGQFLTLLDVAPEGVPESVARVIRSGAGEGVTHYRAAKGIASPELPAVLVQGMVAASVAGVAFGADPVCGRTDRIVVSAVRGLADRLVAGEEDGETWRIDKGALEILEGPQRGVLTADGARAVARLCRRAESRKGSPQDVEWAFGPDGSGPHHLQDRPITSRLLPAWTPESRLTVLDNSNIVESYPGLVSPLTFSFAVMAYARVYRSFLGMVGVPRRVIDTHASDLANMLSLVDGRIYYNLGSWYRLLSVLPLFSRNRRSMETMMGVSRPIPQEALGATRQPGAIAAMRLIFGLLRQAILLRRTRLRFMARIAASVPAAGRAEGLAAMPLSALASEYRRIEAALLDRWDAPIVNDFFCMMAYGASRRLLERWVGDKGLALHNDVMIGQGDIVSAEPARLIRKAGEALAQAGAPLLAAIAGGDTHAAFTHPVLGPQLRAYVNRFGDRRIGELKLESPTLSDNPAPLLAAVVAASRRIAAVEPSAIASGAGLACFAAQPMRRWIAAALLAYAKARVRDRENLRFERTRIFARARRVFLAIGGALAATGRVATPDDVFFLTVDEVLGAAEGHAVTHDLPALIAVRKAEHARCAALADPPQRILLRGAVGDRGARVQSAPKTPASAVVHPRERRGTPCGSGRATGSVRVIRDPIADQLQPGEVLVARHTDPGWVQHFVNAAAVVVERGSVLSHSAIVSRELGIPCVVALADACTWLSSGDLVEVDGSTGVVRRIDA
jgi:rifampicin phosphotransferase